MQTMSGMRRDFLANHLRSQLMRLRNVLDNIIEEEDANSGYAHESLKSIELSLRQIRKLCINN